MSDTNKRELADDYEKNPPGSRDWVIWRERSEQQATPPADAPSDYWLDGKVIRKGSRYVAEIIGQEPLLLRELLTGKDAHKPEPADAALAYEIKRACAYYRQAGCVAQTAPMLATQHEHTADKIIAAALRARSAVPEGFVMVPARPTSDQLLAGVKTMFRSHGTQNGVVGEMYAAMLAASKGGAT